AGGSWLAPGGQQPHPGPRPATVRLTGADPAWHVTATAALTATSWGTSIQLRLRGAPRNVRCELIVRSRSGQTEVSGAWEAWRDGTISIPASAAWRPADIASLQVRTATAKLVTLRAGQR
ncbi:MAG: hypothetical protein J2P30_10820, partial [Actinobacteria bacterium]|nr:hypothetical protein [Actinomycetota bacterium]